MRRHPIASFGTRRHREAGTLIRQASGTYVAGIWTPGAETSTDVTVISAPTSAARARDVLPEGARLSDSRTFWLEQQAEPLRVGADQTEGDVIEHRGTRYRLLSVYDWTPHTFVEVVGIREEGQESDGI